MAQSDLEKLFEAKVLAEQQRMEELLLAAGEATGLGKRVSDVLMRMFAPFLWVLTTPIRWGIKWAIELVMDTLEVPLTEIAKLQLNKMKEAPDLPDEMKDLINWTLLGGGGWQLIAVMLILGAVVGGGLSAGMEPVAFTIRNFMFSMIRSARIGPYELLPAVFRDPKFRDLLKEDLGDQGFSESRIEAIELAMRRIPEIAEVRDLNLRGMIEDGEVIERLGKLGFNEEDTEAIIKLFPIIPGVGDMVRFADFSAFDPEVIEKWREFYEAPDWITEPFKKIGIFNEPPDEWANRYWFSHWIQPGRFEIGELHRRGLIDDDAAKLAYRTMGYSRFWQENLLELVKAVPTRVDVRRWWDMGTVSEEELREIYHKQGYYGEDLDRYVLWTKVYVAFPDLIARYKNGWIGLDEVKGELAELGMPPERVDELLETKFKKVQVERVAAERDLTKTDIYKGVNKGIITWEQGIILLMDMGYDEYEADYILALNCTEEIREEVIRFRELTKADIIGGLRTGVISEDRALEMLLDIRYIPEDAHFLLEIFRATAFPPKEPELREASKADITKAVRKGLISPTEGYKMLIQIGFKPEAATFILSLTALEVGHSPISYSEYRNLVSKYKGAIGMEAKEIPMEVMEAERKLVEAERKLKVAIEHRAKQHIIDGLETARAEAAMEYRELLVLHEL